MAKNKVEAVETSDISEAVAATRAEIGNRPRQSVVRFVEYYNTVLQLAPDRIEELFGEQAPAVEAHIEAVVNRVQAAVDKAAETQLDMAIKALTNEDQLNGYAGYIFDEELFAEKTRVKAPRGAKKSIIDKSAELFASASDEDLAALAEMLKARGL